MNEEMEFPNTFEEFLNEYSFKDSDEVYTNGSELIQVFRVMQGYEHFRKQIRADERNKTIEGVMFAFKNYQNMHNPKDAHIFWEMLEQMQKGAEE